MRVWFDLFTLVSRGSTLPHAWTNGLVRFDVCVFAGKPGRRRRLTGGDDQCLQHGLKEQTSTGDRLVDQYLHRGRTCREEPLPSSIRRCWRRFSRQHHRFKIGSNTPGERLPGLMGQPLKRTLDLWSE